MKSPEKKFTNLRQPMEEPTGRLDSSASRAIRAYNRTLLAAGYTDQQIVGIINTAIKECGDKLTADRFLQAPVAALQAEVDRLQACRPGAAKS
jgi:hypothetical protein